MADSTNQEKEVQTELEDTDADTRDIENTQSQDYSMVLEELRMIRAENAEIKGQLNAMRARDAITIEAGAVIQDDSVPTGTDELTPYSQLDFTVR